MIVFEEGAVSGEALGRLWRALRSQRSRRSSPIAASAGPERRRTGRSNFLARVPILREPDFASQADDETCQEGARSRRTSCVPPLSRSGSSFLEARRGKAGASLRKERESASLSKSTKQAPVTPGQRDRESRTSNQKGVCRRRRRRRRL